MLWIASIICLFSAIYHYYLNRGQLVTVGGVISLFWGTVNMINAISPYDWYPLSEKCETIILLGSIAIVIGLFTKRSMPVRRNSESETIVDVERNYKVFFSFQVVIIVLMLPMVIKAIGILMSNNMNMSLLRDVYATGGTEGSYMTTIERLFYIHYIIGPAALACILINSILFFKYNLWKKPLIFTLVLAILMTIYSAARTSVFFAAISIMIAYFQYKGGTSNQYNKKKVRKRLIILFVLFVGFMSIITVLRGNTSHGGISYVFKTLISYFCGGTHMLNVALENPSAFGLDTYSYGYCTFAGLFSIINLFNTYLFGSVGLNILPMDFSSAMHVQDYLAYYVRIGTMSSMNAFPTMFYFFLRDGGILFLIVVSVLFGRLISKYERKSALSNSLKNTYTYTLLFYTAIMTVCWWEPIRTEFWMMLIWGRIICGYLEKRKRI